MKIRNNLYRKLSLSWIPVAMILIVSNHCFGQNKDTIPDGTDGSYHVVRDYDSVISKFPPNEFDGSASTFRIGLGYIHDFVTYSQDKIFKQQLDSADLEMEPTSKLRDFRILGSGRIKIKRTLAWKFAYMYDGDKNTWLVRESGITIGVPELAGHIFVGRTKEGFSMVKVMNGHSPWAAERQMAIDVIPILADGIKWFGYLPKPRIFWNLGYYNDIISEGQGFSTFEWQYVARIGWMPVYDKEKNKVLHIATNLRYAKPLNGKISLKSKPEANPAPQIINTGTFDADKSNNLGAEIYYSNGKLLIGSEVVVHNFYSDKSGDHSFFGGDIQVTYLFTKTKRPYSTTGSLFGFVPVKRSIFRGGWGEWEGVIRFSTLNLNDGNIKGGSFWRITPMVNWYMSKIIRLEFIYGYGVLDRYNMKGAVQIFQARMQFTVM